MTYKKFENTFSSKQEVLNKLYSISILKNDESPYDFKFKDENGNELPFEEIILLVKYLNEIFILNGKQLKSGLVKAISAILKYK